MTLDSSFRLKYQWVRVLSPLTCPTIRMGRAIDASASSTSLAAAVTERSRGSRSEFAAEGSSGRSIAGAGGASGAGGGFTGAGEGAAGGTGGRAGSGKSPPKAS